MTRASFAVGREWCRLGGDLVGLPVKWGLRGGGGVVEQ